MLFFFSHTTAYEMRISDWSSDLCSSDLSNPIPSANFLEVLPFSEPGARPCAGRLLPESTARRPGIYRGASAGLSAGADGVMPSIVCSAIVEWAKAPQIVRAACCERVFKYV